MSDQEPPHRRGSFVRRPRREGSPPESPTEGASTETRTRSSKTSESAPGVTGAERAGSTRERIVVPRQERGRSNSPVDIELREVRWGETTRGAYLRVVPSKQRLTRTARGHIMATIEGSRPPGAFERVLQMIKRVLLGTPFSSAQAIHERLTKVKALAVLGSDPLSSSAYATEEAVIILAAAGAAGFRYALPISLAVAIIMGVVVISYLQTQRAYPSGGGAYIVAHENLGRFSGLIAAGSLIVDYTLLVSVSVAAGVAAITSAVPELLDWRVPISVAIIAFFTFGNLRGIRESGTLFSAPTYFFIFAMGAVVAIGLVRVAIGEAPGSILHAAPPREEVLATQGVTLWLILRAFSSGGAALTGVEAMSNNIPNFQPPESRNAQKTLAVMAVIAIYLFLGITYLTTRFGLAPTEDETIVSQLGREILGGGNPLYFAYQASTAMVLFLAANTSFYDFPLLSAILARDKYMPRQFAFRGDRLAYSNGILVLTGAAVLLLIVFNAETTRLIPLYAIGVFVSFTLSQSGMVRHWLHLKERGWQASLLMNGVGAVTTGVVAVIITATKFSHGAWISILMMLFLVLLFWLIRRHYEWYERVVKLDTAAGGAVALPTASAIDPNARQDIVIVPVDAVTKVSAGALAMAREVSADVTAVHLSGDRDEAEAFRLEWEGGMPDVPLLIIESPYRAFAAPMLAFIDNLDRVNPDRTITIILPAFKAHHWWEKLLHNQAIRRLKPFLAAYPRVRIVEFDYDVPRRHHEGQPPAPASASA